VIPDLLRLVEEEPQLNWSVGEALERIGAFAVPHLLPHLQQNKEQVQECVLRGLKGAGETALPALPGLLVVLSSGDQSRRALAAEVVARIGPAASAARNDLLRLLRDKSAGVREAAVAALGAIGPAAGDLSAVSVLLSDDSPRVRESVLRAVPRLDTGKDAINLLTRGLKDRQLPVRQAAVEGLIALGEAARAALEGLRNDKDEEIRSLVLKALGED
jgi:HEAT repeat protein